MSVWRRMAKGRHIKSGARGALVAAIAAGIVLLALGGVSFAAYRYDQASADRILPGVTVGGVDVGGMTRADAVEAVQAAADVALARPLTVRAGGKRWTVTPAELGRTADVGAAVDRALEASASVGFVTRVWHRLRDESVDISVGVSFGSNGSGIGTFVSTVEKGVAQAARDAS